LFFYISQLSYQRFYINVALQNLSSSLCRETRQRAQEEEERAADAAIINAELAGELAALREALAANEADIENYNSGGEMVFGQHSFLPRGRSPLRRSRVVTSNSDMRRSINSGIQPRDAAILKGETRKSPGEVRRSTEADSGSNSDGRGFAPLFAGTLNLRKSVSKAPGRE
jgi:hypothetical protein